MKSGLLDKNGIEICDGDLVNYTEKYCTCRDCTNIRSYVCKVKFEYGGFYLLSEKQETIYYSEVSISLGKSLSQLAMREDDHRDGYYYYLPMSKLDCIEIIKGDSE